MFYKKKYRSAIRELEGAKKLCAEQGIAIQSAKTMYDNLLTENDNLLNRISSQKEALESERRKIELLQKQKTELENSIESLTESNNDLKRELHQGEEALKKTEAYLDTVIEQTKNDSKSVTGQCEGCIHKVTKNYRKCGSCTRNVNAVDKFVLANEVLPSDVAIGEIPTAEEAAEATEQAEIQTGECEIHEQLDSPKETASNNEYAPTKAPKAKSKYPKKKNRKRNH